MAETEPRLTIAWDRADADYAAAAVEDTRPDLAQRMRRRHLWELPSDARRVSMSLGDARALVAATAERGDPDAARRESAWTAALEAQAELEREERRLDDMENIRPVGLGEWRRQLDERERRRKPNS